MLQFLPDWNQGARMEFDRLFNLQQNALPAFTETGFKVVRAPEDICRRYRDMLATHRSEAVTTSPDGFLGGSKMPLLLEDLAFNREVGERLRPMHEAWCGVPLAHSVTYGVRLYLDGSTLARHCDTLATHVISSILHLDRDMDEPWLITMEDVNGVPREVNLEPGDLLLYESAKCPHYRLTPFRGRFYASVFIHYRPAHGWNYSREILDIVAENDPSLRERRA
jgi:hypothetical protein